MAKHSGISPQRLLLSAKVALLRNPTPGNLYDIRAQIPPSLYAEFIDWVMGQSGSAAKALSNGFPASISQWKPSFGAPKVIKVIDELYWAEIVLGHHAQRLKEFVAFSVALDKAFLLENESECQRLLDLIEKDFGVSYWLIKRRIAFLQHFQGLEAQKRYAQALKGGESGQNPIRYIAHFVSNRAEFTVSPFTFKTTYNHSLQGLAIPEGLKAYLRYHLLSQDPQHTSNLAWLLSIECHGTIIDYYDAFISMSRIAGFASAEVQARTLTACSNLLRSGLTDIRLSRLVAHCGGAIDASLNPGADHLEADSLFCQGDYAAGFEKGLEAIKSSDTCCSTYVITALCAAAAKEIKATPAVISGLKTIIAGGEGTVDAAYTLARIAWALQGSPISNVLAAVLEVESAAHPLPGKDGSIDVLLPGMGAFHPIQVRWARGSNFPYKDLSQIAFPTIKFGSDAKHWNDASAFIEKQKYVDALNESHKLTGSVHPFFRRFAARAVPHCLLMLNRIDEAVESTANSFVEDQSVFELLPVNEIVEALDGESKKRIAGSLAHVVVCDMYANRMGPQMHHVRQFAYEDYLTAHRVLKPTQLNANADDVNIRKLIYFFKNVCVESVMDTSVAFHSSVEVAEERIEVCRRLVALDDKFSEEYQAEIRGIVQRLTIRKRLREIEQSKIYVDIDSIKNAARRDLGEGYSRYISFITNGLSTEDRAFFDSVKEKTAKGDIDTLLSTTVPRNERTALLETIYLRLRDEFVSSTQHGLDGYLSVRIRHGTLAGQLRSPLEAESLLTQRDAKTNLYKANRAWLSRLDVDSPSEASGVSAAFSEFSKQFDALIEELLREWIQVKKTSTDIGLIDFNLLSAEIGLLSASITAATTLDEFIDKTLEYFFRERLEVSLSVIRKKLQEEAKPRIHNLLIELQTAIKAAAPSRDTSALRVAVGRASTNVHLILDRIIDWFRLPAAEKNEPFSIEEAISICKEIRPDFRPKLTIPADLGEFRIKGNLHSFVDIMYLAFDNIVKHAGTPEVATAEVDVKVIENALLVSISNSVGPNVASEANCDKVKSILDKVKKQPFSTSVTKEGGTGFHKLQKILHHDFCPAIRKVDPALDFGFVGRDRFRVDIQIPVRWQVEENNESSAS